MLNKLADTLFGRKKPKIDYAAMNSIVDKGVKTQTGIAEKQFSDLSALNKPYEEKMTNLGKTYEEGVTGMGQEYLANLKQLGSEDELAAQKARVLAGKRVSQSIPINQALIRQNLAATGNLRTGAAGRMLQQPVLDANRQLSEYGQELDIQNLQRQSARQEKGVDAMYSGKMGASLERLGLDKETFNTLLQNGRTDIISKSLQLLGISEKEISNLLGIQGIQANAELADTAAYNQGGASLLNAIMTGIGMYAGKGKKGEASAT